MKTVKLNFNSQFENDCNCEISVSFHQKLWCPLGYIKTFLVTFFNLSWATFLGFFLYSQRDRQNKFLFQTEQRTTRNFKVFFIKCQPCLQKTFLKLLHPWNLCFMLQRHHPKKYTDELAGGLSNDCSPHFYSIPKNKKATDSQSNEKIRRKCLNL